MAIQDGPTFTIDCTGDACAGDIVLFKERVFGGSYRRPKMLGKRRVTARILRESYGRVAQQHTFTLEILSSDGCQPLRAGTTTTRKGRNLYRLGTRRQPWADEDLRQAALDEKHQRGDAARAAKCYL